MTVAELIQELEKIPGHKEVLMRPYDPVYQDLVDTTDAQQIDCVAYQGPFVTLDAK